MGELNEDGQRNKAALTANNMFQFNETAPNFTWSVINLLSPNNVSEGQHGVYGKGRCSHPAGGLPH